VTYPAGYVVPEVWESPAAAALDNESIASAMKSMNRATAGARSEEELPRGTHDLQLYSLGTPNGMKVTILLEELGVEYDAWKINISDLKQFTSGFVKVNPNSKIPAMYDYGPDAEDPIRLFESGSILMYLSEKFGGQFVPKDLRAKAECMNWLMWQMGSGSIFGGGFGHFYKYAPIKVQYCIDRYSMDVKRLLDVLEQHLAEGSKKFVCGEEYTIADMAIMPWVKCLDWGYSAGKFLQVDSYKNVDRWMQTIAERKAVKRGLRVNGFGPDAVVDRHSKDDFKPEEY